MKYLDSKIESVCVFCGAATGRLPVYATLAADLGKAIADEGLVLVYGGANEGLMGVLANSCLAAHGKVSGVIPAYLVKKEVAHTSLTEIFVVDDMHARKAKMNASSDGFIILPGGLGTLEEFFEVMTWTQLGIQQKPCILMNVEGFFDKLLAFIDHAIAEGFMRQAHLDNFHVVKNVSEAIAALYLPVRHIDKWAEKVAE